MKRIIINITEDQYEQIRKESFERSISISKLVREYLDGETLPPPEKIQKQKEESYFNKEDGEEIESSVPEIPKIQESQKVHPVPKPKK